MGIPTEPAWKNLEIDLSRRISKVLVKSFSWRVYHSIAAVCEERRCNSAKRDEFKKKLKIIV